MRRAHKLLSLLLVLTLALSLSAPVGAAYSDTSGHWAESAIDRWSAYGIVSGDGNGFNPDGNLTRGQMAKVLAETLGLTKEAEQNPFADVAADAWYAPYVLRCYEAGIMQGDGANANPDATITREQAMVMLCRALGIAPASEGELDSFADSGSVADWAAPYVAAMVQSGIVNGVGNNSIAPTGSISRASLMTILDRSIVQYINEPGSYELTDKVGIVLVAAGDVTLTGATRADVLVSTAAEGKSVAFNGATVTGSVTVQAEFTKVTSTNSRLPDVSFTATISGKVEIVPPTRPSTTPTTRPATTPTGGGSGSSGDSGSSHTHTWNDGVVTTEPTATAAGVKTFTCTGCGQTRTESIAPTGETEKASDYVYVSHFGLIDADGAFDTDGDIDGHALGAKVYHVDGTSEVVTVNTKWTGIKDAADGVTADNAFRSVNVDTFNALDFNSANAENIYKLVMKDGKAVLSNAGIDDDLEEDAAKNQVKKSISTIIVNDSDADKSIKADGKTVFFYVNDKPWDSSLTVTPYVGINNVRASKDNNATVRKYILKSGSATMADAVLVLDGLQRGIDDTVYFFTGNYDDNDGSKTVTYDTYINGEEYDLIITYDTYADKEKALDKFVGETGGAGVTNKFFTLDSDNMPVVDTLTDDNGKAKVISKFCYTNDVEIKRSDSNDSYTFIALAGGNSRNGDWYAYDTAIVIDASYAKARIESYGDLQTALKVMSDAAKGDTIKADDNDYEGRAIDGIKICVQFANDSSNTVSYIYVVGVNSAKVDESGAQSDTQTQFTPYEAPEEDAG